MQGQQPWVVQGRGRQLEEGSGVPVRSHQTPAQSPGCKAATVIAEGRPAHPIWIIWTQQPELKTSWHLGNFETVSRVFQQGLQLHPSLPGLALAQPCKTAMRWGMDPYRSPGPHSHWFSSKNHHECLWGAGSIISSSCCSSVLSENTFLSLPKQSQIPFMTPLDSTQPLMEYMSPALLLSKILLWKSSSKEELFAGCWKGQGQPDFHPICHSCLEKHWLKQFFFKKINTILFIPKCLGKHVNYDKTVMGTIVQTFHCNHIIYLMLQEIFILTLHSHAFPI